MLHLGKLHPGSTMLVLEIGGEISLVTKLRQREFITEQLTQPAGFPDGQVETKDVSSM